MSASRFSFWAVPFSSVDREWSLLRKECSFLRKGLPPCFRWLQSMEPSSEQGKGGAASEDYREVQEGTMRAWIFQSLFFRL